MSRFDIDLEYGSESIKLLTPILRKLYPRVIEFNRSRGGGEADREYSIDIKAIFPDRTESWAVKTRRPKFINKRDVTLEILNGGGGRGDYYRFKGGNVNKYIYAWRTDGGIGRLFILDAEKLAEIDIGYWIGSKEKNFTGLGKIKCYHNKKHGGAWFTAIPINILKKKGVVLKEL